MNQSEKPYQIFVLLILLLLGVVVRDVERLEPELGAQFVGFLDGQGDHLVAPPVS